MPPAFLARASAVLPLLLFCAAPTCRAAPVTVDPAALALLQKVQIATQKTHSLSAAFTDIYDYQDPPREFRSVGVIKLMKPNYAFEQHWNPHKDKATGKWIKDANSMTTASDGKTFWTVFFGGEYRKDKADPQGRNVGSGYTPASGFFDPSQSVLAQVKKQQAKGQLISLTYAGTQTWEGRPYQIVSWQYKPDYFVWG